MRIARKAFVAAAWCVALAGAPAAPLCAQAPARPDAAMTAADSTALVLLERAARGYASERTLRAAFTQTLTSPRTGSVLRSTGEFLQRGTRQFAFRFTEPAGDQIVADGEVLWLYLPSTAKGQVLKVPRAAGAGLDIAASLLRDPRARYRVVAGTDTTLAGRTVRTVHLTPRRPDSPFTRATLWLDARDALIRRLEFVEASGLERLLEFTNVRTAVALPADAFRFTPPAGVRIIDQAALMGGSVPPAATPRTPDAAP